MGVLFVQFSTQGNFSKNSCNLLCSWEEMSSEFAYAAILMRSLQVQVLGLLP